MLDPPPTTHLVSNYPRAVNVEPNHSLAVGKELLKAYYQCPAIGFTMVGWFIGTFVVIACCVQLRTDAVITLAAASVCLALTTWKLFNMCSQPIAALAYAGSRSPQFELRWRAAICILGPLGLGLALVWMLRGRIVAQLEPYGIADDLTSFPEREVYVLLDLHFQLKKESGAIIPTVATDASQSLPHSATDSRELTPMPQSSQGQTRHPHGGYHPQD